MINPPMWTSAFERPERRRPAGSSEIAGQRPALSRTSFMGET